MSSTWGSSMLGPMRVLVTRGKVRSTFECDSPATAQWLLNFIEEHCTDGEKVELLDSSGNEWVYDRIEVQVLRPKKVPSRKFLVQQTAHHTEVIHETQGPQG
jgi:hypothetical protein